jgi:O-antigen ligase
MWAINMWLHLICFFIVVGNVLKTKKEWFSFLNIGLIFASYIAIYGYLQRWGVEGLFQTGITRIQSVLGNSAYVAGILLLSSILSFYLLIKTRGFWWKSLFALHILIQLPAMFMAEIRGAQIAFFVVLLFVSLVFLFKLKDRRVKYGIIGLLLVLILIFGLAFQNKEAEWVKNNSVLHRLTTISLSSGTARTRLISWEAGLKTWQENPFLGYGMENYYYSFDKYFQADYYNIASTETWFDRAHNMVMENLVAHGIFGLLAYLSIFIFSLIYLYKVYKKDQVEDSDQSRGKENWLFSLFFSALIIAYFIQNFFVFDSLAVTMFFFFILAYVYHQTNEKLEINSIWEQKIPGWANNSLIAIGVIVAFYLVFGMNYTQAQVAKQNYEVQKSFYQDGDLLKTQSKIKNLLEMDSYLNRDSLTMTTDTLTKVTPQIKTQEQAQIAFKIIDFLIKEFKEHEKINDQDAYFKMNLARLYMLKAGFVNSGTEQGIDILKKAQKVLEETLELSVQRLHVYYFLYQIHSNLEKTEEAIQILEKALSYNDSYGQTYIYLANAYLQAGRDKSEVLEVLDKVLEYGVGFTSPDQIKKLITLYEEEEDYIDQKIILYEKLINLEKKASYYTTLGQLYQIKGQTDKAEEYLNQASKLYNKK